MSIPLISESNLIKEIILTASENIFARVVMCNSASLMNQGVKLERKVNAAEKFYDFD